jgi:hypothetical protein
MIQGDRIAARLTGCALSLALAACSGGSNPAATATPSKRQAAQAASSAAKKGPTIAEQTAGMVSAVSLGKSALPVGLKFELAARPEVGRPLAINLVVLPQIAAESGSIAVTSADGFEPLAAGAAADLAAVAPEEAYRRSIKVTPARPGVLLLTLGVSLKHDENSETREFSVPILVEEPPRK